MSNEPQKPMIVAAWTCPACGGTDSVEEIDSREPGGWVEHSMECTACGAEWKQYADADPAIYQIEYDGQTYPIPPSPEDRLRESAPALRDCLRRTLATVMASHRFGARQEIEDDILKTLRTCGDPYPYAGALGMVCPRCGSVHVFCDWTDSRDGKVDAAHLTCGTCSHDCFVLERGDRAFAVEVEGVVIYSREETTHV